MFVSRGKELNRIDSLGSEFVCSGLGGTFLRRVRTQGQGAGGGGSGSGS